MKGINLVAAAFALTALSYGLARFAYGLFLPQIREDLALSVLASGWIGGGAFAAYCLGIGFTFAASGKIAPRMIALFAGVAATAGMAIVTIAASGWVLGIGIAFAGLSSGLASPPLASAVSRQFRESERPKANGTINAGTAVGIVFSGIAALMATGSWRELYTLFALIGAGVSVWLWLALPPGTYGENNRGFSFAVLKRDGVLTLCLSAFVAGVSSTAVWTFGANILRGDFGFSSTQIAWVWIVLGAVGVAGSLTGVLTHRYGTLCIHAWALLGIGAGTLGLAATSISDAYGFAAMGLFGMAYIISTGTYLIQGIELLPDQPDLGLGIPFLMLALGQTLGTPLFGATLEAVGTLGALCIFAMAAGCAGAIRPRQAMRNSVPH